MPDTTKHHRMLKGISLGMAATLFWGGFYPVSRILFNYDDTSVDALNFTVIRFIMAALVLLPLLVKKDNRLKAHALVCEHWKLILSLGLIGIVCEGLFVFWALQYTTAARASLMANTSPISTLIISRLAGKEFFNRNKITGMLIGFAGILMVFLGKGTDAYTANASTFAGDLMGLVSGICWAYYTVFGDGISQKYGGLLCAEIMFLSGLIYLIPLALIKNHGIDFNLSWQCWLGVIYLGILSYALANSLWYMALTYVTPGELGSLGYVSAMLAMSLSMIFLGERFTWSFALAVLLVLGGVALMLKPINHKLHISNNTP